MDYSSYDEATRYITDQSLYSYQGKDFVRPTDLAMRLFEFPGLKMHCPQHHYLIPAVMLTAAYKAQGRPISALHDSLIEAMMRAKNLLPGFCGLYGNCGAAVGLGIYASILTEATPYSVETWALANRIVAESLLKMSEINGPRCCKRNCYIALLHGEEFTKAYFGLNLGRTDNITCPHYTRNEECKKKECPFFPLK